ncbi:MAG TPA: hypothetical protein VFG09_01035 [Thermodesulfovibrionales bacterium]|nr:hypothetical protein [Thermodesulfovibrionales bacterium]
MTFIVLLIAYLVYAAFIMRFVLHVLIWWRSEVLSPLYGAPASRLTGRLFVSEAADIFFFRRLFRVNSILWFGEWLFHIFFFLTALRHLRYFLDPVPGWIICLQPVGICAGYLLPFALVYILALRLLTEREEYLAPSNLSVLLLLFLISITGVLMHGIVKPDVVSVKEFIIGMVTFKPVPVPKNLLFILHFALVLILVPFLPTHIFVAPFVIIEARKRDEGLGRVMHD